MGEGLQVLNLYTPGRCEGHLSLQRAVLGMSLVLLIQVRNSLVILVNPLCLFWRTPCGQKRKVFVSQSGNVLACFGYI